MMPLRDSGEQRSGGAQLRVGEISGGAFGCDQGDGVDEPMGTAGAMVTMKEHSQALEALHPLNVFCAWV